MNLKKTASLLKKAPSYTKNTALLGESVLEYWLHYFSNRRFLKNQEFYVVYTNVDNSIPFQPNSALDYWLINLKFLPISIELGDATSGELVSNIVRAQ